MSHVLKILPIFKAKKTLQNGERKKNIYINKKLQTKKVSWQNKKKKNS